MLLRLINCRIIIIIIIIIIIKLLAYLGVIVFVLEMGCDELDCFNGVASLGREAERKTGAWVNTITGVVTSWGHNRSQDWTSLYHSGATHLGQFHEVR